VSASAARSASSKRGSSYQAATVRSFSGLTPALAALVAPASTQKLQDAAAREVVDAFVAAVGQGDLAGLLAVLAPEVELRARSPEGTVVIRGASKVARRATLGARPRPDARAYPALIDGVPGILVMVGGRPVMVMAFTVADGAITVIRTLTDPDRLAQVVPSWVP